MIKKSFFFLLTLLAISPLQAEEPAVTAIANSEQFEDLTHKALKPVIIDFWAPWCGPCMKMKPLFEQLAEEQQSHFHFATLNIDEDRQLAEKYEIKSIPAFIVIKDKELVGKITGQRSKDSLLSEIQDLLGGQVTLNTLSSAIGEGNLEKVSACITNKDMDVNGVFYLKIGEIDYPMTPLILAISRFIFWDGPIEIVKTLIRSGAKLDLELECPEMDREMHVNGTKKISPRLFIEHFTLEKTPEELAAIQDDNVRTFINNARKRAIALKQELESL